MTNKRSQPTQQLCVTLTVFVLVALPSVTCGKLDTGSSGGGGGSHRAGTGGQVGMGGRSETGNAKGTGGNAGAGDISGSGVASTSGGASGSGGGSASRQSTGGSGPVGSGGTPGIEGAAGSGDVDGGGSTTDLPQGQKYVVAMVQSSKANAADLTMSDVVELVADAVSRAGGLDFIRDGQTVVLKPNLVWPYEDTMGRTPADPMVNGITTDWRVAKAVADLARSKNPKGRILVMEGSVLATAKAYALMGYTTANFGSSVDEFVAIEGGSCRDTSTGALERRTIPGGKQYWLHSRYVNADVVISLPTMKTHLQAGITGAVKNLGIGTTPVGRFSSGTNSDDDCTRGQTAAAIDHSNPETLGQFIHDYYSIRPADFVVMDGLQGLEHGPHPGWDGAGYAASMKNMRLILAGKNAVAVDTIAALVMKCDPKRVPHLTKLEADGLGTTDTARITVVGKQVSEVRKPFASKQTSICPGT